MNDPGRRDLPARPVAPDDPEMYRELVLADLLNRVLDRGVVVRGSAVISVAGVDLVHLGLQLVLSSTETLARRAGGGPTENDPA